MDFITWQPWGDITIPRSDEGPNKIISLYPVSLDKVVARWQTGIWLDRRTDSLSILKRSPEGVCGIDSLVFADLGEGILIPAEADAAAVGRGVRTIEHEGKRYVFNMKRRLLSIDSIPMDFGAAKSGLPLIELDDGFVLANRHYGMFWVFDGQGRFRRRIRLFDQGTDDDLCQIAKGYWQHERAVLGCQPARDGNILVATRSIGAVLFARKDNPLLDEQGQPEKPEFFQARQRWSWLDRPDILWWEVDPKNGSATVIDPPLGAPNRMTESIAASGLTWTYNLNGEPVFSSRKQDQVSKPQGGEKPASSASGTQRQPNS